MTRHHTINKQYISYTPIEQGSIDHIQRLIGDATRALARAVTPPPCELVTVDVSATPPFPPQPHLSEV